MNHNTIEVAADDYDRFVNAARAAAVSGQRWKMPWASWKQPWMKNHDTLKDCTTSPLNCRYTSSTSRLARSLKTFSCRSA